MICFHFTIFVVLETTFKHVLDVYCRCDLLSFYIFVVLETTVYTREILNAVVICFHFTIFVVLETTTIRRYHIIVGLWFAFILLSLSYWKQLSFYSLFVHSCCDLLSFYYLCRTGNNWPRWRVRVWRLWFAFILLSLSYWKQRWASRTGTSLSCDLLSFYYLCRTGNNGGRPRHRIHPVVICFHFTIFVVLETTSPMTGKM